MWNQNKILYKKLRDIRLKFYNKITVQKVIWCARFLPGIFREWIDERLLHLKYLEIATREYHTATTLALHIRKATLTLLQYIV